MIPIPSATFPYIITPFLPLLSESSPNGIERMDATIPSIVKSRPAYTIDKPLTVWRKYDKSVNTSPRARFPKKLPTISNFEFLEIPEKSEKMPFLSSKR